MSKVKLIKFKLRKEKIQNWLDWGNSLKKREQEVIETLKKEGVKSEACFISSNGEFIFYFMEAEDFEKVNEVFSNSTQPIDIQHKEISQSSLEFVEALENLFFFKQ